jgi:CP family cyanate transporter-like MFS transporter
MFALNPLMPLVIPDLKLSFTEAGLVSGVPLLMMGLLSIPGGWLTDRAGTRRTLAAAMLAMAAASFGRALAPSGVILLAATVVLGSSIGVVQPALARLARETLPHNVALASSIAFNGFIVGATAALVLTPGLLLPLLGPTSWREALLVWTGLPVVAAVAWAIAARVGKGIQGDPHARLVSLAPLRQSLAIPGIPALTLAMGTQSAIFYAVAAWLPSYLAARGWSVESIAVPLAVFTLGSLVTAPLTAPTLALLGYRLTLAIFGLVIVAGFAVFLAAPDATAWLCALTVAGGTTILFGATLAAPAQLAPASRVGTTAGVMLAVGYVEATLGPFALGVLRDVLGSYELGWWFMLGLAVVLVGTALGVPGRQNQ